MSNSSNVITCPFTIVIDSREQLPWHFDSLQAGGKRVIVPTERATLLTGDYSIRGFENEVAIERKSVPDFYNSITSGRRRLEAEFQRMESMKLTAIIVEGRLDSVLEPGFHGRRINPQAILATIASWTVKYQPRWFFSPTRELAERLAFALLEKFHRKTMTNEKTPDGTISGVNDEMRGDATNGHDNAF